MLNMPQSDRMSVYPGEFIPEARLEHIAEELNKGNDMHAEEPLTNITELDECYKVEVAVPGAKREDFFLRVADNILSVTVFHSVPSISAEEYYRVQEFTNECFYKHIMLPVDVDVDFVSAEYKNGVLLVYLPKDGENLHSSPSNIVVY